MKPLPTAVPDSVCLEFPSGGRQTPTFTDPDLRRRAEAALQSQVAPATESTTLEMRKLLHELQVHQIELELQNEELRAAQAEVEAGLARYTDLYDFAPAGYFTLDRQGVIDQLNLAGAALLHGARNELCGRHFDSYLDAPDRRAFADFLDRVWASAAPRDCEVRIAVAGQTSRTVEIHATRSNDGLACRAVATDITERKAATEQLRLAALVYQAIGESIMVSDADNRIVAINPAFTAVTGYSEQDALGQFTSLLKSGHHDEDFYQRMWATLEATGRCQGEIINRRKNGEVYAEWMMIGTIFDDDGAVLRRVAMFSDITEKKLAEATIWQQANYDPLTNLPNRNLFHDRLQQELKTLRRQDKFLALMFIDLDNFKEVNDTLGHTCGDNLLVEAARRIAACVRDSDTVARLGGDEFTIILANLDDPLRVEQVARQILLELAKPYALDRKIAHISASIGITLYPADAEDIETLIGHADQAMYAAKALGRNRYSYFTAEMQQAALTRQQLGNDLRGALAAGQLLVHYQPIIDLASGRCVKAEALLRWSHPLRGMVGPAEFIPLAEQTGLITEIGHWVFCQAAGQVKRWIDMGADCMQVSVNKSPRQFDHEQAQPDWHGHLRAIGLSAACITIEITEGLLLDARPGVTKQLQQLRAAGIQISLDDFGTGYSAMSYLKKFPIDYLKIDQSFVRDMAADPVDRVIVEAIIAMAHKLGMKVVAEGVETAEQRDLLVAAGCDFAQGYWFAWPMPQQEFVAYLEKGLQETLP